MHRVSMHMSLQHTRSPLRNQKGCRPLTLRSLSEIAFFALGRLSKRETTPGRSGTGSRYASAAVEVWMNRRPDVRDATTVLSLSIGVECALLAANSIVVEVIVEARVEFYTTPQPDAGNEPSVAGRVTSCGDAKRAGACNCGHRDTRAAPRAAYT